MKTKKIIKNIFRYIGYVLIGLLLFLMTCNVSFVKHDDLMDYSGYEVMKNYADSVGNIQIKRYIVRDTVTNNTEKLAIDPEFDFYKVGDIIK